MNASTIELFDLNGKLLFTVNANGQLEQSLNISNLQPGMYIVQLNGDGKINNKRFIKQ
jgi:hypothetical protein